MIPERPIHPATAGLLILALVVAIFVRVAVKNGLGIALLATLTLGFACLIVWSTYEMWTMPPDDERWDIIAEMHEEEQRRRFQ